MRGCRFCIALTLSGALSVGRKPSATSFCPNTGSKDSSPTAGKDNPSDVGVSCPHAQHNPAGLTPAAQHPPCSLFGAPLPQGMEHHLPQLPCKGGAAAPWAPPRRGSAGSSQEQQSLSKRRVCSSGLFSHLQPILGDRVTLLCTSHMLLLCSVLRTGDKSFPRAQTQRTKIDNSPCKPAGCERR